MVKVFLSILFYLSFGLGGGAVTISVIINRRLHSPFLTKYLILLLFGTVNFTFGYIRLLIGESSGDIADMAVRIIGALSACGLNFMFIYFAHHLLEVKHILIKNIIVFFLVTIPTFFLLFVFHLPNQTYLDSTLTVMEVTNIVIYFVIMAYMILLIAFHLPKMAGKMKRYVLKGIMWIFILFLPAIFLDHFLLRAQPEFAGLTSSILLYFFWNLISILFANQFIFEMFKMSPEVKIPQEIKNKYGFTDREEDILLQVIRGKTNQEIADQLFISIKTVKSHLYNIFQKTKVKNRVELVNLIR